MKTIEVVLYQFAELSAPAKLKAINWMRNLQYQDSRALDFFAEYCEERANEEGFSGIELRYSLSWSQGDGLSFSAKNVDIDKLITETLPDCKTSVRNILKYYTEYSITANNGHYAYASKRDVDLTLNVWSKEYFNIESLVTKLRENLENKYMALCKELEKVGYKCLEDEDKDENIIETIEANEYDFTEEGERY